MSRAHTCGLEAKHIVQDNCPMTLSLSNFQGAQHFFTIFTALSYFLTGSLAETKSDMSIKKLRSLNKQNNNKQVIMILNNKILLS